MNYLFGKLTTWKMKLFRPKLTTSMENAKLTQKLNDRFIIAQGSTKVKRKQHFDLYMFRRKI